MIVAASAFASTPTSIGIASSANPSEFGHAVTLTATVSPAAATGKVTFYLGTTILEIETLANGTATLTTSLLPSGSASLKAYYGGDSNYAASTSALLPQTVNTVPASGFESEALYPASLQFRSVAVGDFNGDGKADLAFGSEGDSLTVFLGNGDGTFQPALGSSADFPYFVAVGDFNGDGKPDLVAVDSYGYEAENMYVLLGNGDGTFQPAVIYAVGYDPVSVVAGDFNGDGKVDVAVANESSDSVSVLLGNGDGTFQAAVNYYAGVEPVSVAVGDFNGDGRADLAVATVGEALTVLLGNGNGTFQAAVSYSLSGEALSVAVADFNGDGRADLAAALGSDTVSVLLGNGDGTFRAPLNFSVKAPTSVAVGDFNGDGQPDLVASSGGSAYVSVLLGNGDGTFQTALTYPSDSAYLLVVADFNGDGRDDVALAPVCDCFGILLGVVPTSTALATSPNPSTYGQTVSLTATVSPASATGTVTFLTGSTALGSATLADGIATFSYSNFVAGAHSLSAEYRGAVGYSPSTSAPVTQSVKQAPTATTLTSSPNPSVWGKNVVLTAVVSPSSATGTVSFSSGSTTLGTVALAGGEATLTVSTLPVGEDSLTATYSGDTNHLTSTSPILTQTIGHAPTTTTLTSSPNPSADGQTVTLKATVSPASATGTLTFLDGTAVLETGTFGGGTVTLNISTLAPGQHSLTAAYSGSSKYSPSTSPVVNQVVQ
jgi:hypothetical protein